MGLAEMSMSVCEVVCMTLARELKNYINEEILVFDKVEAEQRARAERVAKAQDLLKLLRNGSPECDECGNTGLTTIDGEQVPCPFCVPS